MLFLEEIRNVDVIMIESFGTLHFINGKVEVKHTAFDMLSF